MIALRIGICRWMKCDNQGMRPLRSEQLKKSRPTNIDWASCRRAFKSSSITVTRSSWKRPAALELVSVTGTMSKQARRALSTYTLHTAPAPYTLRLADKGWNRYSVSVSTSLPDRTCTRAKLLTRPSQRHSSWNSSRPVPY